MNLINKTVFNKKIKIIFSQDADIINIFIKIDSDSQIVKYKKIK